MRKVASILTAGVAGLLLAAACTPPLTEQASPATPMVEQATISAPNPPTAAPGPTTAVLSPTTVLPSPTTAVPGPTIVESTPELSATATTEPDAVEKTVTLDDQGKTLTLAVGERFLLNLGEGYTWAVEVSDQDVVGRVRNITVVRGAQGIYEGLQPGTATLSAAGDPICRQSKPPCAMPSTLFRITIVVS